MLFRLLGRRLNTDLLYLFNHRTQVYLMMFEGRILDSGELYSRRRTETGAAIRQSPFAVSSLTCVCEVSRAVSLIGLANGIGQCSTTWAIIAALSETAGISSANLAISKALASDFKSPSQCC